METKIVFMVTDEGQKVIEKEIADEFCGKSLIDLCSDHERVPIHIASELHYITDFNAIMRSKALQAVIELRRTLGAEKNKPYGLGLAEGLMEEGIDVLIFVRFGFFTNNKEINRLKADFHIVQAGYTNTVARAVAGFIRSGNKYLLPNPVPERIAQQHTSYNITLATLKKAQDITISSLEKEKELFDKRSVLAARRLSARS
jgi:hypothetical protein